MCHQKGGSHKSRGWKQISCSIWNQYLWELLNQHQMINNRSTGQWRINTGSIYYHEYDAVAEAADDWQVGHVTLQDASGQVGVRGAELLIVDDGVRRDDSEPHKHSKDLEHTNTQKDERESWWAAETETGSGLTTVFSPGRRWGWRWWWAGRWGWWIWAGSPTSFLVRRCGRCGWFWSTWQSRWWPCRGPAGGAGMHKPPHLAPQSSGKWSGKSGRYLKRERRVMSSSLLIIIRKLESAREEIVLTV